jgi:hypothetical protein
MSFISVVVEMFIDVIVDVSVVVVEVVVDCIVDAIVVNNAVEEDVVGSGDDSVDEFILQPLFSLFEWEKQYLFQL